MHHTKNKSLAIQEYCYSVTHVLLQETRHFTAMTCTGHDGYTYTHARTHQTLPVCMWCRNVKNNLKRCEIGVVSRYNKVVNSTENTLEGRPTGRGDSPTEFIYCTLICSTHWQNIQADACNAVGAKCTTKSRHRQTKWNTVPFCGWRQAGTNIPSPAIKLWAAGLSYVGGSELLYFISAPDVSHSLSLPITLPHYEFILRHTHQCRMFVCLKKKNKNK